MARKIIPFLILFLFGTCLIYSQKEKIQYLPNFDKRKLHFGYYIGLNQNSYKVSYYAQNGFDENSPVNPIPPQDMFLSVDASPGFNIGFVVDYRLHKNINLRFEPGLMSNSKKLTFQDPNLDATVDGIPIYASSTRNLEREVASTYLHLPVLLKLSTNRLNNIRPYVIGGVSYDYNFSSNQNNSKDNFEAEFRTQTHNFMYEVGVGVDFYLYFFKFTPSIRGVFAINDELVGDDNPIATPQYSSPWTGPIDFLGTRGLYLNLTFE